MAAIENFPLGNGLSTQHGDEKGDDFSRTQVKPSSQHEDEKGDDFSRKETAGVDAPDGGWGWAVCLGCFIQSFLYDGVFYTFGIVFLELTEHFATDRTTGAWISSLNFGVCMTTGPIISAMCQRLGYRRVTVYGACVTSVGLLMSCFAPGPHFLYFSYGVVAGFGYGMVSQASITVVTTYFRTRRSFATGLSLCGNGLGVFVMSPMTEWLIQNYTWRGAFLVQSGLLLHGVTCGLVYRPLVGNKTSDDTDNDNNIVHMGKTVDNRNKTNANKSSTTVVKMVETDGTGKPVGGVNNPVRGVDRSLNNVVDNVDKTVHKSDDTVVFFNATINRPNKHMEEKNIPLDILDKRIYSVQETVYILNKNVENVGKIVNHMDGSTDRLKPTANITGTAVGRLNKTIDIPDDEDKTPRFSRRQKETIRTKEDDIHLERTNDNISTTFEIPALGHETFASPYKRSAVTSLHKRVFAMVMDMFDLSLLKSIPFCVFTVSTALYSLPFYVPILYLPDVAKQLGIDAFRVAWVLSGAGVIHGVCGVMFGWLADRPGVNRLFLYIACVIGCGVTIVTTPFCTSFGTLLVDSITFGLFHGLSKVLITVLVTDLLSIQALCQGYGILNLFSGIASMVGPPFAGWMFDVTRSYDVTFYVSGVIFVLSGAMLFTVPCLKPSSNKFPVLHGPSVIEK